MRSCEDDSDAITWPRPARPAGSWRSALRRRNARIRHQARMAFCTCSRFSASSHTTDCGPSITSGVTSSPRWAGRQCMKMASGLAAFITARSTWNGFSRSLRFFLSSPSPMETQTSVTTQSAPLAAASGSCRTSTEAPSALAQARSSGAGLNCFGQASFSCKPKRAAACTQEVATLLASPSQATVLPSIDPFFSSKVMTSAMTWQGWVRLVSPLITGTVACAASSSSFPCEPVLIMIAST